MIESLWELAIRITQEHAEALKSDPSLASRLDADPELQAVHADRLVRSATARQYDLHSEYTSFAPVDQRWSCIDLSTYDGAPDSQAPCTFIGRGRTEGAARDDLLAQFAEQDAEDNPKPRASRVIFSSQFEPPEYAPGTHDDWSSDDE
jgi:hypothetical protein